MYIHAYVCVCTYRVYSPVFMEFTSFSSLLFFALTLPFFYLYWFVVVIKSKKSRFQYQTTYSLSLHLPPPSPPLVCGDR